VPLDGPRAQEQLRADLRVRLPVRRTLRDLKLLPCKFVGRFHGAPAHRPGGQQLAPGGLGINLHADVEEHLVCGAELLAGVDAAGIAAQPLAVDQQRAAVRDADANAGADETLERLAVELLGRLALGQQRASGRGGRATIDPVRLRDLRQRSSGPAARSGLPPRAAASIRSTSSHIGVPSACGSSAPRSAAVRASP
jgi:hypothetical protein